ncbi:hypothetical protein [Lentzea sp. CC55]|uniref:hypothetical protein n=1 Tax=Lentzea sp. CC55 TaxID=2884909 RepID=UPI001F2E86E3|nr:hypothetical protein [Lentzea sp. CC55]MCG8925183.1 hypothetical protein [Lentzea sp. CC55]
MPLQRASLVVISIDAVVILSGFVTGSPLLPRPANVVLTVISLALVPAAALLTGGGYDSENPTLPAWSVVVAAIALPGGAFLFAHPLLTGTTAGTFEQRDGKYAESEDGAVVRELTEDRYESVMAASQRGWTGPAVAFAGGTFLYAGIRHRR